jgi:hypothetical protein
MSMFRLKVGSHAIGTGESLVFYDANDPLRNVFESDQQLDKIDPAKFEKYEGPPVAGPLRDAGPRRDVAAAAARATGVRRRRDGPRHGPTGTQAAGRAAARDGKDPRGAGRGHGKDHRAGKGSLRAARGEVVRGPALRPGREPPAQCRGSSAGASGARGGSGPTGAGRLHAGADQAETGGGEAAPG